MSVTGRISSWALQESGDIFEKGMEKENIQIDAYQPEIFESKKTHKKLVQVHTNKFLFIGTIEAILVRDLSSLGRLEKLITNSVKGDDVWEDQKKKLMGGYTKELKKTKEQDFGPRAIVDNIIVDCGIPIRLNYGNEENHQLLNQWSWIHSLPPLKPGMWIAGECELVMWTSVVSGVIGKSLSGTIAEIHKVIRDSGDENFGKIIEVGDSGHPWKLGVNELFITLSVKRIGNLWDDTEGRIGKVLK